MEPLSFNSVNSPNIEISSLPAPHPQSILPAIKTIKKFNQFKLDSKLKDKQVSHLSKQFTHSQTIWNKIKTSKTLSTKIKILEKLVQQNDLKAMHVLGTMLIKNLISNNYNGFKLLEECVENHYIPAYFTLAQHYFSEKNYDKAEDYYDAVLCNPHIHPKDLQIAKFELANIYVNHITENFEIGKEFLKENANHGHSDSIQLLQKLDLTFKEFNDKNSDASQLIQDLKTLNQQVSVCYHNVGQDSNNYNQILCPKNTSINYPNIHANKADFFPFYFIVMKYPFKDQCEYFWDLCMQHRTLIVDLINIEDIQKNQLFDYAPRYKLDLNDFSVSEASKPQKIFNHIHSIKYQVQNKNNLINPMIIPKLHYLNWHKETSPNDDELTFLVQEIIKYKTTENQRIIVHSLNGTDRTMTLVVACRLYHLIQNTHYTFFNKKENPDKILIQTLKQLIFMARESRGNNVINEIQRTFLFNWGKSLLYSCREKSTK